MFKSSFFLLLLFCMLELIYWCTYKVISHNNVSPPWTCYITGHQLGTCMVHPGLEPDHEVWNLLFLILETVLFVLGTRPSDKTPSGYVERPGAVLCNTAPGRHVSGNLIALHCMESPELPTYGSSWQWYFCNTAP